MHHRSFSTCSKSLHIYCSPLKYISYTSSHTLYILQSNRTEHILFACMTFTTNHSYMLQSLYIVPALRERRSCSECLYICYSQFTCMLQSIYTYAAVNLHVWMTYAKCKTYAIINLHISQSLCIVPALQERGSCSEFLYICYSHFTCMTYTKCMTYTIITLHISHILYIVPALRERGRCSDFLYIRYSHFTCMPYLTRMTYTTISSYILQSLCIVPALKKTWFYAWLIYHSRFTCMQSLYIYDICCIHHSPFSYMACTTCMTYTTVSFHIWHMTYVWHIPHSHILYIWHMLHVWHTLYVPYIYYGLFALHILLFALHILLFALHILQHTATHCNTLQHTATHCNTLQHTTTHCNTLHCIYYIYYSLFALNLRQEKEEVVALVGQTIRQLRHYWNGPLCQYCRRVAVSVSELQCVAVRCSVLQCVAVCCSVLQCVVQRDLNGPQWVEV